MNSFVFLVLYYNVHGKNRQSSYQCLRTTLVRYPDDIRGRRRANEARKILEYEVLGDEDFFHTLELTWDNFYDKYATFGKPMVKWIYSEIFEGFQINVFHCNTNHVYTYC